MTINGFVQGLAQMIGDASIGVWDPTGTYTAGQVAVVIQAMPQEPDQIISLSPRPIRDDPYLNDSVVAVQFRHRGSPEDPLGPQDRDDAVFDLIQGLSQVTVGGLFVVNAWRQGGGPLGQDENLRWERASTFYFQTNQPTTHRTT